MTCVFRGDVTRGPEVVFEVEWKLTNEQTNKGFDSSRYLLGRCSAPQFPTCTGTAALWQLKCPESRRVSQLQSLPERSGDAHQAKRLCSTLNFANGRKVNALLRSCHCYLNLSRTPLTIQNLSRVV